jgi:hypothetical protein
MVGVSGWVGNFQPTMWESMGLPLGGRFGAIQLVWVRSRCSTLKGGSNLQRPSNSYDARLGITYRARPTWRWSNNIIHASGNTGVIFHPSKSDLRLSTQPLMWIGEDRNTDAFSSKLNSLFDAKIFVHRLNNIEMKLTTPFMYWGPGSAEWARNFSPLLSRLVQSKLYNIHHNWNLCNWRWSFLSKIWNKVFMNIRFALESIMLLSTVCMLLKLFQH